MTEATLSAVNRSVTVNASPDPESTHPRYSPRRSTPRSIARMRSIPGNSRAIVASTVSPGAGGLYDGAAACGGGTTGSGPPRCTHNLSIAVHGPSG